LKHEREYYWGLALLVVSCFSLVWALWRDAFRTDVFLAGLLAFSWGYALLWRHDIGQSLASLSAEVAELKAQLAGGEENAESVAWAQELPASEGRIPAPGTEPGETLLPTEF